MPLLLIQLIAKLGSWNLTDLSHFVQVVQNLGHVRFRYFASKFSREEVHRNRLSVLISEVLDLAEH